MLKIKDLYWLAGLIEGEGCFSLQGNGSRGKGKCWTRKPNIRIGMADKDVLDYAARIFNTNVTGPYKNKLPNGTLGKDIWHISINGNKAIQWMMTLYSLMSQRRKNKIEEIINYWKANHKGVNYRSLEK